MPFQAMCAEAGIPTKLSFLTEKEELEVIRVSIRDVVDVCTRLKASDEVLGTACTFLHRFYLKHSVHVFDPSMVLYACLFLACKCEEFNVSIEIITRHAAHPAQTREFAIKNEVLLIEALRYHLVVYSCFRPLRGLLADVHVRFPALLGGAAANDVYAAMLPLLRTWLVSDVTLQFPPSQIALCGLRRFLRDQGQGIDMFLTSLLEQGTQQSLASLHARFDAIERAAVSTCDVPSPQRAAVSGALAFTLMCSLPNTGAVSVAPPVPCPADASVRPPKQCH